MPVYAKASKAFGYCDRTGFRYPLSELVYEYQNGVMTGMRVGRDVVDPDQPQNFLGRLKIFDPQSLLDPRPDRSIVESRSFFGWNPVGNPLNVINGAVGTVTITVS